VSAWVQEVTTLELKPSYHLVVCQGLLHLLLPDARLLLVERLKAATLPPSKTSIRAGYGTVMRSIRWSPGGVPDRAAVIRRRGSKLTANRPKQNPKYRA
jgi:hypothetical protein